MFFSLEKIKYLTSREYLNQDEKYHDVDASEDDGADVGQANINALLDELLKEIDQKDLRYEYEERAAILEYDGGLTREDADRVAAVEVLNLKQAYPE